MKSFNFNEIKKRKGEFYNLKGQGNFGNIVLIFLQLLYLCFFPANLVTLKPDVRRRIKYIGVVTQKHTYLVLQYCNKRNFADPFQTQQLCFFFKQLSVYYMQVMNGILPRPSRALVLHINKLYVHCPSMTLFEPFSCISANTTAICKLS